MTARNTSTKESQLLIKLAFEIEQKALKSKLTELEKDIEKSQKKIADNDKRYTEKALGRKLKSYRVLHKKLENLQNEANKKEIAAQRDMAKLKAASNKAAIKEIAAAERAARAKKVADEKKANKKINDNAKAADKKRRDSYVSKWKRAFSTLTRYMSAGTLIGVAGAGVKDIVSDYLQMEQALLRVAIITGDSYNETLKLKEQIYQVSAAYGIAAKEVSSFVFEMSKLGKSQEDIGLLAKEAASLSSILGEDMALTGKLLVTAMNQYNIVMADAALVTTTFIEVVRNSPMTMSDLQTTLQYVGTAANAAGLNIQKTGVMIEFLSSRGLRASKVGTGLRNVLLEMSEAGYDVEESLAMAAEKGITLAEALEKFGKRGAAAAFLIISNWEKVADLFDRKVNVSIENTLQSLSTTIGKLNWFTRKWAATKGLIFGVSMDEEAEGLRTLAEALAKAGVSVEEFGEKSRIALDEGKTKELYNELFSLDKNSSRSFVSFMVTSGDEVKEGWNLYLSNLESQLSSREDAKIIRDASEATARLVLEEYKYRVVTMIEAEREMDEIALKMKEEFTKKGFEDSEERMEKFKDDFKQRLLVQRQSKTRAILEDELADISADLNDVKDRFNKGLIGDLQAEKERDALYDEREYICSLFKKMEIANPFCDKAGRDPKRSIANEMKLINNLVKDIIQDSETALAQQQFGDRTISQEKGIGIESIIGLKSFRVDKEGTIEEIAGEYQAYAGEILEATKTKVVDLANEKMAEFAQQATGERAGYDVGIGLLRGIIGDPESTDENIAAAERQIEKYETAIKKIDEDLLNSVGAVREKMQQAILDLEEQGVSVDATLRAIIFGENKSSATDKTEKVADMLNQVANYLNELSSIYKQWSDEMFNQLKERLDSEKASISARFDYERDALRLAAENNLLTQEQYSIRSHALEKKRIERMNAIARKQFEVKKKQDIKNAIIDGGVKAATAFITTYAANAANPVTAAILGAISFAIVGAQAAIRVSSIRKREFSPVEFAEGGMVEGRSHTDGGIPFSVAGQGGYEMEGGEYIVRNSSVNADTLPLLDAINGDTKYNPRYFESGGQIVDDERVNDLDYNVTRAYITEKDLDSWERNKVLRDETKNLF